MRDGRFNPPSFEEIALSAAHLVAVLDDPKLGFDRRAGADVKDSFTILKSQCEAAGLMAEYPRDDGGCYKLWPLEPRRERAA